MSEDRSSRLGSTAASWKRWGSKLCRTTASGLSAGCAAPLSLVTSCRARQASVLHWLTLFKIREQLAVQHCCLPSYHCSHGTWRLHMITIYPGYAQNKRAAGCAAPLLSSSRCRHDTRIPKAVFTSEYNVAHVKPLCCTG